MGDKMSDGIKLNNGMYDMSNIGGCGSSAILVDKQVGANHFLIVHGGCFGCYLIINGVKNFVGDVDVGSAINIVLKYNDAQDIVNRINKATWRSEGLKGLKQ